MFCFTRLFTMVLLLVTQVSMAATVEKTQAPQRIVSLSLCTDELLLTLAEDRQIAALSFLSTDPRYSWHWQRAQALAKRGVVIHHGMAEQLVVLNPDLIIGARFEAGKVAQILEQLGYPVVRFDTPTKLSAVPAQLHEIGERIGTVERTQETIRQMQTALQLAQKSKPRQTLLALTYAPNGYTFGTDSLKNDIVEIAGIRTVARQTKRTFDTALSVESLLTTQPDLVIFEELEESVTSLSQQFLHHPALKNWLRNHHQLSLPIREWLCPGPWNMDAVHRLQGMN